jgi:hypothetical protein
MINFADSSKNHTSIKKSINTGLKNSLDNISYRVKLGFISQLREDLSGTFKENSSISLEDFNKFITEKYEKQINKLNKKKNKVKAVRKGPVKVSPYNLFVKLSIPKLRASYKELGQNDLMKYSGKIWQVVKAQKLESECMGDKFNFEKFVKDNKIIE